MLLALCRPLLDRDMFTEPASTRAIADELVITQAAVKHIWRTCTTSSAWRRRLQPALAARERGVASRVVSLAELRRPDTARRVG